MIKGIKVTNQFPRLTASDVLNVEKNLNDKFGYTSIPDDYKQFLQNTNGCLFETDENIDEDSYIGIALNLPFIEFVGVAGVFGVWLDKFKGLEDIHTDWPELLASNENSKENFDVLPDQMMSFAYEEESSGALFAMSVAEHDFGQVYYYHDDYLYSIIGRKRMLESHGYCYYDRKAEDILQKHNVSETEIKRIKESECLDPEDIISTTKNLTKACIVELKIVQFIPIASSLNDFMDQLVIESYE